MQTSEAVSTVIGLWPKCFQPLDTWRRQLVDEFDVWTPDERSAAVNTVKVTHTGKRVTIQTFRDARRHKPGELTNWEPPAESDGMHEARVKPPEGKMKGFAFRRSMLRLNPIWAQFLDSIHPTHEHSFFAAAVMGELQHEVKNCTTFEAQYIREKWGKDLEQLFGRDVTFSRPRRPS